MKIGIVVGTRPEIIKMAPVVRACISRGVPHVLFHTGQHYSFELDGVFFRDLELPEPDHNLEVGSGTQAYQIASIVSGMEPLLAGEPPDVLLGKGDTNDISVRRKKRPAQHSSDESPMLLQQGGGQSWKTSVHRT